MTYKELLDAFDVREGFETIAVRLAAEKITAQDPDWLIDGRWGVLQFYPGSISKLF